MSKISVTDLARIIAKKHKMTIRESEKFITALIDVVNNALRYEKQVKIKGLGTFKVIDTKNRKSVNINTGESIVIEGRGKITFTPDAVMRDLINKPFAQFATVPLNDGVEFEDIEVDTAKETDDDETVEVPASAVEDQPSETSQPVDEPAFLAAANLLETETPQPTEPEEQPAAPEEQPTEPEEQPAASEEQSTEPEKQPAAPQEDAPVVQPAAPQEEAPVVPPTAPQEEQAHIHEGRKARQIQYYREYCEDLEYKIHKDAKRRKWYAALACCLIAAAAVGGYYAGSNMTRDQLLSQYQTLMVENVPEDSVEQMMAAEAQADSAVKALEIEQRRKETELRQKAAQQSTQTNTAYETARERAMEMTSIKVEKEKADQEKYEADLKAKEKAREARLNAEAEARKKAEAEARKKAEAEAQKKAAEASRKVTAQTAPAPSKPTPVSSSKYDEMSTAVRLGAYRIVGIDQTVTVRKGQTLKSISKAFFGPGMECYVEALNGGIKEVSEGQKLKIPKLELRKKKQK